APGRVEGVAVDVAADVAREGFLRPAPFLEGARVELEAPRRRREAGHHFPVDLQAHRLSVHVDAPRLRVAPRAGGHLHSLLVLLLDVALDQEGAVSAHVVEGRAAIARRRLRKARHRVLEDPAVVLLDGKLLARAIGRLEPAADPQGPVGIDAPAQLDPELVFFPDLARVRLVREPEALTRPLARRAHHRLPEAHPLAGVRLLALDVVTLARVPHGQDV